MVIEIHIVNLVFMIVLGAVVGWSFCGVKTAILKDRQRDKALKKSLERHMLDIKLGQ